MSYKRSQEYHSFNVTDFFKASLDRTARELGYDNSYSSLGDYGLNNSNKRYYKKPSRYTNSIVHSAMHGGGLYEAYDLTPSINAVRRAASLRTKDMLTKYKFDMTKTPGLHVYMKKIGFGSKHYMLSRAAQNAVARAASSEAARDKNRHPYSYYVEKQLGFKI